MDGARIQAKVYRGQGIAARRTGQLYDIFRPVAGRAALDPANANGSLYSLMTPNAAGVSVKKPSGYDGVFWQATADGSLLQIGDYLVQQNGNNIYFVAEMEHLLPILAVSCNATITITRPRDPDPGDTPRLGVLGYQGLEAGQGAGENGEDILFSNVPAAMAARAIGKARGLDITPSDSAGPVQVWFYVSPSLCPEGSIRDKDMITDQFGFRHQCATSYWTNNGYRLQTTRMEA